jgi:hypothetical protein
VADPHFELWPERPPDWNDHAYDDWVVAGGWAGVSGARNGGCFDEDERLDISRDALAATYKATRPRDFYSWAGGNEERARRIFAGYVRRTACRQAVRRSRRRPPLPGVPEHDDVVRHDHGYENCMQNNAPEQMALALELLGKAREKLAREQPVCGKIMQWRLDEDPPTPFHAIHARLMKESLLTAGDVARIKEIRLEVERERLALAEREKPLRAKLAAWASTRHQYCLRSLIRRLLAEIDAADRMGHKLDPEYWDASQIRLRYTRGNDE